MFNKSVNAYVIYSSVVLHLLYLPLYFLQPELGLELLELVVHNISFFPPAVSGLIEYV